VRRSNGLPNKNQAPGFPTAALEMGIYKLRLITSGHESYASQAEAYEAGQAVLADMVAKEGLE
jgi:hypothetical protein